MHLWDRSAHNYLGLDSLQTISKVGEKGMTLAVSDASGKSGPMRRRKALGNLESLLAFLQAELACTRQSQLMNGKADVMRRCLCPDLRQE